VGWSIVILEDKVLPNRLPGVREQYGLQDVQISTMVEVPVDEQKGKFSTGMETSPNSQSSSSRLDFLKSWKKK
jgi:hypothetical protein